MRIEKIELIGFKSFADRTVLDLHPGITCIVGPNGCGKSNIVDSFKWVLGEQSAKSLRGEKMEEVIFNGSLTKKPKGMAEVSLSIIGLGGSGNGDSDVTTIARRLYRSGESEYLINREICRLKDIRDIFLDTGLEVKSYSILEQDRISSVLNSKPEDRRFLIEEVAGVVKYKVRRAEALSKLQSSRQNLQRVKDIISEVKRQINSLDRQVKKAERYKRLMGELREIELRLAKRDYDALRAALSAIAQEAESLRGQEASLRAELSMAEVELESAKLALVEKEKQAELMQEELRAVERELALAEQSAAVLSTEKDALRDNLSRITLQQEETIIKISESKEKKEQAFLKAKELQSQMSALEEDLRSGNESLGLKEDELLEKEEALELKRRELFSVSEELSNLKNELRIRKTYLEDLAKKESSAKAEFAKTESALSDIQKAIEDIKALVQTKQEKLSALKSTKADIENRLSAIRTDIENKRTLLSSAREELASVVSRLESLKEMVSGGEPVRDINALTSVAEAIDVPAQYERAVEAALREAINAFIMSSAEELERAVELLKQKDSEKTALVALDISRALNEATLPEGVIGRASEFVNAREPYHRLIKNILHNVFIVNDLKGALCAQDCFTYVTLDGEVVEPSGVVIAGKGKGLLRLKRQIRELEAEAGTINSRVSEIQADIEGLVVSASLAEEELARLSTEISDAEREIRETELKKATLEQEKAQIVRKLETLTIEVKHSADEQTSIEQEIKALEDSIQNTENTRRLKENELSALQAELQAEREIYETQKDRTVDIRLELNSLKERAEAVQKEISSIDALMAELTEKSALLNTQRSETETRLAIKEQAIAENEEARKALVIKASQMQAAINQWRELMAGDAAKSHEVEQKLKSLRGSLEPVIDKLHELEVSATEHRLRIENLASNIKTNYGTELESLQTEAPLPEDEERLTAVRQKIEELGPVSLGSIDEYEELRGRYEFLTKQESDIEQSIAELEEAISKINSTTKKRLRDAFDALNAKFNEIFVRLFGGGSAELRLTDEGNILESGIEIACQPPGKRLQNISLLSGGEKTLTVLSLLFASFLIKPTPLCVLDEADAALDESNTEKFAQMLKDIAKETQFIVITHNKVTMEAANYIYGITMEEAGVSKVMSLELVDAQAIADKQ